MLPFLDEYSLNDLIKKHGKVLRNVYRILNKYPQAFEKLLHTLTIPVFFELLAEFESAKNETAKSRKRLELVIDDTQGEKMGKCMEFIHKLFDHCKDRYIMGYNFVFVLVIRGEDVFPLSMMLWLPKKHKDHRTKIEMSRDFINTLKKEGDKRQATLKDVDITFDSAYYKNKLIKAVDNADLRLVSKPSNTFKFEFEDEFLHPKEITEKVKNRSWNQLEDRVFYQRVAVKHPDHGNVVLIVRKKYLDDGKIIYDVLVCNKRFFKAHWIHKRYKRRWEIECHFKYYKQYLNLGKSQFRKLGSIRSHLYCVAMAGLIVALYRQKSKRKISFRRAVKLITNELRET